MLTHYDTISITFYWNIFYRPAGANKKQAHERSQRNAPAHFTHYVVV